MDQAIAEPDAAMTKEEFEALVAKIASDTELQTSGQRALALVEAVIGGREATGPARRLLGEAEKSVALTRLGLKPREVDAAASVLIRSRSGDIPPEALDRVRKGLNLTCDSLRTQLCAEKRGRRKAPAAAQQAVDAAPKTARAPADRKSAKKARPASSLEDEAARILADPEADNQTRRSLALIDAAVAMRLIDPKAGGNKRISLVSDVATSALGVKEHEFYSCWIAVRAIAARKLPKSARNVLWNGTVGAGHYESVEKLKRAAATGAWKRRSEDAEVREIVGRVASRNHLFMPTPRAIAVLEALAEERILDPSLQVEKDIPRIYDLARGALGVSKSEFEACWAAIRAVKRRELPRIAIDYLNLGEASASSLGLEGLKRIVKDGTAKRVLKAAVDAKVAPAAGAKPAAPAAAKPELKVKVAKPIRLEANRGRASAGLLLDLVKDFHNTLDLTRLRAGEDGDAELVKVVEAFLDEAVHMKTRAAKLAARRVAEGGVT